MVKWQSADSSDLDALLREYEEAVGHRKFKGRRNPKARRRKARAKRRGLETRVAKLLNAEDKATPEKGTQAQ